MLLSEVLKILQRLLGGIHVAQLWWSITCDIGVEKNTKLQLSHHWA